MNFEVNMDFEANEEQVLLRDLMRRFLADHADAADAGHAPMPRRDWLELGQLGVLSLLLPETEGGLGGGAREIAIVAEELGRGLAITPFAESIGLCGTLIAQGGDARLRTAWLAPMMRGDRSVAYVGGKPDLGAISARRERQGWRLNGENQFVRHAAEADAFLVCSNDGDEPALLLVEADARGVSTRPYRLADGDMAAVVSFDQVELVQHARLATTPIQHRDAMAFAELALAAEMIGVMSLLYEATIDYVRQRRQFGAPIGTFQVVQHRMARLFILLEQSRSMVFGAALCEAAERPVAVTAAKAYVTDAALRLAQEATQLHGGLGVTEACLIGRGHRRILVLSHLFGGALAARAALATLPV